MKPGFPWFGDLQPDFVRRKKVWHLSAVLPWLGADSLMPTKECAHAVALLARGAIPTDSDPIFMKLPGTSCLSAHCPSKLGKHRSRTSTTTRCNRWTEKLAQN